MAHALGNPFDLTAVLEFCRLHDLWLIEDNCDALGCLYSMPVGKAQALGVDHLLKIADEGTHPLIRYERCGSDAADVLTAPTGMWGDISTQSFYPPHHLTMGRVEPLTLFVVRRLRPMPRVFATGGATAGVPRERTIPVTRDLDGTSENSRRGMITNTFTRISVTI